MKKASPLFYFLSLFVCLGLLLSLLFQHFENSITLPTLQTQKTAPVIVLDAGHGGEDGGTQAASGVLEKNLNLKIAELIKKELENQGVNVVMT